MSTWFDPTDSLSSRTALGVYTSNGAWAPTISPITGGTIGSVTGKWTNYLIGTNRIVFMNGVFVITAIPTPTAWSVTNAAVITALPFTSIATNQYISITIGNGAGAVETVNCRIGGSGTSILLLLANTYTAAVGDTVTMSFSYQAI
jgi:hypothetical protein